MATKTAILSVKIVSDAKDFTKKMDDSASKLDKFKDKTSKLTLPATAILAGLAGIATSFGKAASDAEQMQGGVNAVFGSMSKEVDKFASTSADRLGLSGAAYDELAAQIGTSLKGAGVPMEELAGKTDELATLGADLSSVFGGTTTDAVSAMGAAFRGEFDSLEKYGYSITAATVAAGLAEDGLDGLTGAELEAAKKQEVLNQLLEQGAPYMGNFAAEAGTAAGQQERLTAKFADMSAQLGTALLPLMTQAADVLSKVATWVMENQGLVTALAVGIGILAAAVLVLNGVLLVMNVLAAVNPFVLIAVAVVALVGFIIYLATQTQFFQTVWAAVAAFATAAWAAFTGFVSSAWNAASSFVMGILASVGAYFGSVFATISALWGVAMAVVRSLMVSAGIFIFSVVNNIKNAWNTGFSFIRSVVASAISNVRATIANVGSFISSVLSNIRNAWNAGFAFIRSVVQSAISAVLEIIRRVISTVSNVISTARNVFSSGFNFMRDAASRAISGVVGVINNITGAVRNAINWVRDLFNMGGMPGWMSKLFGGGATGFDLDGTFGGLATAEMGVGATGGYSLGNVFAGRSSAPTVNNTNINVTFSGLVTDKVGVAREINKIMSDEAALVVRR